MGQGACAGDGTTCCPFFNTDGSCTTACPTNYAASNDTDYTCGKYIVMQPIAHASCQGIVFCLIFQNVLFLVHWVMNRTHLALAVFQCISVSPAIPVRMEQHVIAVPTATLTTPAHALKTSLVKIAQVTQILFHM